MRPSIAGDESSLILKAQKGDQQAFCGLVNLYHDRVINVVFRMCGDPYMAEDAAQMAFIKAWQHLDEFRPGSNFRNWLYRIAVNTAVDLMRRNKRNVSLDENTPISADGKVEMHIENQERIRQIRAAVLALPEASRSVIILREYEELSYREIASTLGISIGTVMSRLNYARNRLAEILADYLEEK